MKTIIQKTTKEHFEKYFVLSKNFNIYRENMLGFTAKEMREKLEADKNLNNIPLALWDNLAIYQNWKSGMSLAEMVCTLKHAAIYHFCGAIPEFED